MKVLRLIILSMALVGAAVGSVGARPAAAAPPPPPAVDSYYISDHWFNDYIGYGGNGHSIWYNFGYYAANVTGVSIISFGQPCIKAGEYGYLTWYFGCLSNGEVSSNMHSIQAGYDANTAHDKTITFLLGMNTSGTWPNANYVDAGYSLSLLLSGVANTSHTVVFAGIDAEDEMNWTGPGTIAVPFAHGFDVNFPSTPRTILMYDYGYLHEASWNPTTKVPTFPTYTANDHNLLAWAYRASYPFFQQYNSGWAPWITHMSLFSGANVTTDPYNPGGARIYGTWYVPGVLSGESPGFELPNDAWVDVWNAVNTSGLSQPTIDYLSWQRTLN